MFGMAGGGAGAGAKGAGMLAGLAGGMRSFGMGSVKILAGAATIAGVITAIGAGIAAATYLTGKALPTLVAGLEGIANLEADKIANSAAGIGALGTAILALAGGTTGGFSGIFDRLTGGDSPGDTLRDMADGVTDLARAIDRMDIAKTQALAELIAPGATAAAAAGTTPATATGTTATTTTTPTLSGGVDSTALLQRLLDVQTRQGNETNDLLRRISNDI